MKVIYKVEINFDPNNLSPDELDGICEQTDQIFEEEDLDCTVREKLSSGRKSNFRMNEKLLFWD